MTSVFFLFLVSVAFVRSMRFATLCNVNPIAAYDADSFDPASNVWSDLTENGHDATFENGDAITAGNMAQYGQAYFGGPTGTKITFPPALNEEYTLFTVAAYPANAGTRGRIFNANANNWLSGFWNGSPGCAHHDAWLRHPYDDQPLLGVNDWVISADQRFYYHATGYDDVSGVITQTDVKTTTNTAYHGPRAQITINGYSETTDFLVAEVIIFDYTMAEEDLQCVEDYLVTKYTTDTIDLCSSLDIDSYLDTCSALDIGSLLSLRQEFEDLRDTLSEGPSARSNAGSAIPGLPADSFNFDWPQVAMVFLFAMNIFFAVVVAYLVWRVRQFSRGSSGHGKSRANYALTAVDSGASDSDSETRQMM